MDGTKDFIYQSNGKIHVSSISMDKIKTINVTRKTSLNPGFNIIFCGPWVYDTLKMLYLPPAHTDFR